MADIKKKVKTLKRNKSRSKKRSRRRSNSRRTKKINNANRKYELIVFDIDNTLFDSLNKEDDKATTKHDHKLVHGGEHLKMYKRPYLKEFMKFCKKNFKHIALWTHADKLWLQKFIDNILPKDTELIFKWHAEHGEKKDIKDIKIPKSVNVEKDIDYIRLKQLSKIYEEYPQFNSGNTLIIEDTEENCIDNLKNCIIVPEFSVIKHEKESDMVLPLLAKYLAKLQTGAVENIDRKGWFKKEMKEFAKK